MTREPSLDPSVPCHGCSLPRGSASAGLRAGWIAGVLGGAALGFVSVVGAPSCLVTAWPDLAPARTAGPFLEATSPPSYQVASVNLDPGGRSYEELPMEARLYTTGSNESFNGQFVLDYHSQAEILVSSFPIPRSDQSEVDGGLLRSAVVAQSVRLPVSTTAGCHSITLEVLRQSGTGSSSFQIAAKLTWWINVGDSEQPSNLLATCPGQTGVLPEGGSGS